MRGFLRTSRSTGGSIRHLGIPFGRKGNSSALEPNFNNFEYEGTLSNMKRWAFGETDILCHGGITVPDKDGNIFKGDECPKKGRIIPLSVSSFVSGGIPLIGDGGVDLGEQIMHYECEGDSTCKNVTDIIMKNVVYTSEM